MSTKDKHQSTIEGTNNMTFTSISNEEWCYEVSNHLICILSWKSSTVRHKCILLDWKEKELTIVLKSNSKAGYNLLQRYCPSSDLIYGLEEGNHKGEMLLLNLLFLGLYLTFPVYMFYSENNGMLFWYWLPSQLWLAPLVMVFFTCERIHVSCSWEAVLNHTSNYSSCCSKTRSFSFKTASLLLVADSTYSSRFPAHPKSLHVSTSVSNL